MLFDERQKRDACARVGILKKDALNHNTNVGRISSEPVVGEKIILHFHFAFNNIDLDDETEQYLDELSQSLQYDKNLKLKITGHTDNRGSQKYNLNLSELRANEVKKYLMRKGIEPQRIATEGKGMTEPLNDNSSGDNRARNRRVEIKIIE